MNPLNNIKEFIVNLDQKNFFKYLLITFACICSLCLGIMYYFYNRVNYWKKQINTINMYREDIKQIVDRDELVLKQRAEVNRMLTEVPDFKIEGYFNDLTTRLGLNRNNIVTSTSYADRGDAEYREVLLNAKFDSMNMKQLTELLNEIEKYNRIYIKEIEIIKSKKIQNTIEVNLTIATLQRKPETTELTE